MKKCEICGKEIAKSQYQGCVICSSTCFTKKFWKDIVVDKENRIIIGGSCFYDGGDRPNERCSSDLGYYGRRFYIRHFDGRETTTNNLWFNGKIPDEFRDMLPDNAVFYQPNSEMKGGIDY